MNYYNTHDAGFYQAVTFDKFSWIESYNQLNVYYTISNAIVPGIIKDRRSFNSSISTSNDIKINKNKTLLLNVSYWYVFPGSAGLMLSSSYQQLDITIKALLLKKNLTISLQGQDILKTNRAFYTMYNNNAKFEYYNYFDYRFIRLSVSYKFGNDKIFVKEKQTGNSSEKNRAGS